MIGSTAMSGSPSPLPTRPVSPDGRHFGFGISVLLVAAVFIVFGQTLEHGFVNYDDDQYFYANPHVQAGLTESGGEAKQLISEGLVLLNDVVETQKRKKLAVGDRVKANGHVIIVKLA